MLDKNFENDITDLLIKYRGLQSSIETTKESIIEVNNKLSELESERITLKKCKPIIDDIISKFSDSLLHKLEELLTVGLQKIFFDKNYSIQIKVVEKRNSKCVELLLNDNGNLIPVKDSNVAGGILVVIVNKEFGGMLERVFELKKNKTNSSEDNYFIARLSKVPNVNTIKNINILLLLIINTPLDLYIYSVFNIIYLFISIS